LNALIVHSSRATPAGTLAVQEDSQEGQHVQRPMLLATTMLITLVVRPACAQDLDAGRVVSYLFDSWTTSTLALDASPNGNHGTPVNFDTPPTTTSGHAGKGSALVFDRHRKQRIDVGSGAQRSLDVRRFTIAAWIWITETDTPEKNWEIAEKAAAYWMNVRNGHDSPSAAYRLRCGLIVNGVQHTVDSDIRVPLGSWVHVAGTYNGTWLRVYINGVRRGSRAVSGRVDANDYPLAVGANNKPNRDVDDPIHNWMMGSMDDFRLYNRALTKAEIAALARM
jgi:hypothetical protein